MGLELNARYVSSSSQIAASSLPPPGCHKNRLAGTDCGFRDGQRRVCEMLRPGCGGRENPAAQTLTEGRDSMMLRFTSVNRSLHAFAPLPARPPAAYPPMGHQDRNIRRRRSSSCLHVYIAWRIYYHKQLKKIHQKSLSLPRETVMKFSITNLPDEEADPERPESCRTDPESGSLDWKRRLEGCSSDGVKRLKRGAEGAPCADPSASRMRAQLTSVSGLRASCCCVSYPGAEPHPYQTASWSHRADVHLRQEVFKEYLCERFPPAPHVYSPLDSVYLPGQNALPPFLSLL
ncbi:uncharacterized protein LOC129369721 [Poeciliopsis prolifica]|uniref:uncharacterized protein LOC129369721 n=1 Tax=Poeciliopsis prolifica TaxID=188132 RepID=UPI0024130547|nr:uncharacterized protein LOC129369721 [Poeciliopsis prolifica]